MVFEMPTTKQIYDKRMPELGGHSIVKFAFSTLRLVASASYLPTALGVKVDASAEYL